jgi:hypothetical protein
MTLPPPLPLRHYKYKHIIERSSIAHPFHKPKYKKVEYRVSFQAIFAAQFLKLGSSKFRGNKK